MKRLLMIIVAILILPSLVFSEEFSNKTFLKFKKGMVRVKRVNGGWVRAKNNMDLNIGDTIKTLSNGRATVVLSGTAFVKVKPNSVLTIPKDKSNTAKKVSFIKLAKGVLWAHAKKEENSLKVATPSAICGVRGTEFIVEAGRDFMRLIVTKGAVAFVPMVKGIAPKAQLVKSGHQIFFKPSVAKKKAAVKKKAKAKKKAKKEKSKEQTKNKENKSTTPKEQPKQESTQPSTKQPKQESPTDIFNNAVNDMLETSGLNKDTSFEDAANSINTTTTNNTGIVEQQQIDSSAQETINSLTNNFESSPSSDSSTSINEVTNYVQDVIDNTTSDTKTETSPDSTVNTSVQYGQVKVNW
jgi:hypothetical protein